jgi:hypothetical protein
MIDYKKKYLKYKLKYLNLKKNPKKNKLGFLKGGTIDELQAYLNSKNLNLKVHNVPGDGNCLFHAIIHQLKLYPETKHYNLDNLCLREETVNWLKKNPNYKLPDDGGPGERVTIKQALLFDFDLLDDMKIDYDNMKPNNIWDEYIEKLGQVGCWGDTHTINAVCMMLQININVYVDNNNGDRIFKLNDEWPTINIGYVNKNHFVSLISTTDIIKDEETEDEENENEENEDKENEDEENEDEENEDEKTEENEDEETEADKAKTQVQELEKVLANVNKNNVKNTDEILPLALEQIKKHEEENNNPIKKALIPTKDDDSKDKKKSFIEKEAEKLEKALEEIKSYQPSTTANVSTEDNDSKNNDSFAKTIAISAIIVSLLLIFLNK